jgi:hypothetical protein
MYYSVECKCTKANAEKAIEEYMEVVYNCKRKIENSYYNMKVSNVDVERTISKEVETILEELSILQGSLEKYNFY